MATGNALRSLGYFSANAVAFSRDGLVAAAGAVQFGDPPMVRIWRASDGLQLFSLLGLSFITDVVAFSPDGQTIASTTHNGVQLWRASDGRFLRSMNVPAGYINVGGVAFSADGSIVSVANGSYSPRIWFWRVSDGAVVTTYFQDTGYLAYRARKAAFGNIAGKPVPISRDEMLGDMQVVASGLIVGRGGWQQKLEQNKQTYFDQLAASARFNSTYPQTLTPEQFVDALDRNAGGVLSAEERAALVGDLTAGAKTRAQALKAVAEDPDLNAAERNRAFVLMQFFGYLRRDPDRGPDTDFSGYNFWLGKLDEFGGDFIKAEMVKAFLDSTEYRRRFGQ